MALTYTGKVFSWGRGTFSHLGHGHSLDIKTPTLIEVSFSLLSPPPPPYLSLSYPINTTSSHLLPLSPFPPSYFFYFQALSRENICNISSSSRQSACVTTNGKVFVWGTGSLGFLLSPSPPLSLSRILFHRYSLLINFPSNRKRNYG